MTSDIALYKKGNVYKEIQLSDITKNQYNKYYKGYLFCTGDGCKAKLSFVERKDKIKFFRRFPSTPHKNGCLNEGAYEGLIKGDGSNNSATKINLSNKHIINKLESAFNRFNNIGNKNIISNAGERSKIYNENGSKNKGKEAALFGEGIEIKDGKEPYVVTRIYNEIENEDNNKVRCIIGYVYNMQLKERHGYINLTPKKLNSVKVHFAEQFVVNNETEFNNMKIIELYIKHMKSNKKQIICCCIGRVKYVESGINIILDRYQGFTLNGLKFYEIVGYMNDLKSK